MSPLRRPFSRKKSKDKNLPPPPSLSDLLDNPFDAPPNSSHPAPSISGREESRIEDPPEIIPSTPSLPDREESYFTESPELPPPPTFPQNISSRPPFPEPPPLPQAEIQEYAPVPDDLTSDILDELRQIGFGLYLQDTPDEKAPVKTVDEVTRKLYLTAKDDYLAAGNKHLEMKFYENAAVNYTCAILCTFLGEDVFKASHLISELASGIHSSVINSQFFQGTRVLLKANLIRSPPFFYQAEKWLLADVDNLYQEDKEVIRRAIQVSKMNLGLS